MLMVVVEELGLTGIYYTILASHTTEFELVIGILAVTGTGKHWQPFKVSWA